MKVFVTAVALAVVAAGLAAAGAPGFSRVFALPAAGGLAIVNTQKNDVWRPCVLTVVCPSVAERTVTMFRVVGALEYPITRTVATAQTYVYEFQANYWSRLSNGVKVTVSPACTGIVEVIYE